MLVPTSTSAQLASTSPTAMATLRKIATCGDGCSLLGRCSRWWDAPDTSPIL